MLVEDRPGIQLETSEVAVLLEHRCTQLEHWLYKTYGAGVSGDRSTLAQGREAIRSLAGLVDQVLEQLLRSLGSGPREWPALIVRQADGSCRVWFQPEPLAAPVLIACFRVPADPDPQRAATQLARRHLREAMDMACVHIFTEGWSTDAED